MKYLTSATLVALGATSASAHVATVPHLHDAQGLWIGLAAGLAAALVLAFRARG